MSWYKTITPLLYLLPPESAHGLAISMLKNGLIPTARRTSSSMLKTQAFGLEFPNPIGMAAGFDKNAEVIAPLLRQGFGFVEVGTVTPRPQSGNPKPRLFRLTEDEAIINRLGFNNNGCDYAARMLRKRPSYGIVGANIGKNKDSSDAKDDYLFMLKQFYGLSDYITINISSPNTPGLRNLQGREELNELLASIMLTREELAQQHRKIIPLLLKIAPDNSRQQLEDIAEVATHHGVDGLIVSNTTISARAELKSVYAGQNGGLSGKPLFEPSTEILRQMYRLTEGNIPLIGVGGIASGHDAYRKIKAGASLVQLYTALVYQGFGLVGQITQELVRLLEKDGLGHIRDAVGIEAR